MYKSAIGEVKEMDDVLPALTWGYGYSPMMKDKCYANLVVGWGPLIQMFVLNDITYEKQSFISDGFFVIQHENQFIESSIIENHSNLNQSLHGRELSPFDMPNFFVEEITYLSESVLLVLTKSLQYKVFYTQKFQYGLYSHEEWKAEQKRPGSDNTKEI